MGKSQQMTAEEFEKTKTAMLALKEIAAKSLAVRTPLTLYDTYPHGQFIAEMETKYPDLEVAVTAEQYAEIESLLKEVPA